MADHLPRPAVVLDRVLDDPARIESLLRDLAPYWPVQRYMANRAEYATLSGSATGDGSAAVPVAPVFRGDWAYGGQVAPGVEPLLHHEPFVQAARRVFDAEIVRPHTVYVNLTWQLPFPQGRGHVDIPAFRGFDRSTVPVTFLTLMGQTGLFEQERVKVATAVAWFYRGSDGGFEYWPDGPEAPSTVHEGAIANTAIVADNDFMWHRVRPLGAVEQGMASLSMDAELEAVPEDRWRIVDHDDVVAEFGRDALRVSLSWKADVFDSADDARRHDDHVADLDLDEVLGRLSADLAERGEDPSLPSVDPLRDPGFVDRLHRVYMRYPA